jgi:hypothetical protein
MQQSASLPARAAAYVAAALALVYAMVSLYWALGGHALLSTVGGSIADLARRGGATAIALGVTVVVLKLAGALLALALVFPASRPPGRVVIVLAGVGGVMLTLYGGVLVVAGALVLTGVIRPTGPVDRAALRWHVLLWDSWFLAWGIALGLAAWLRSRDKPV